MKLNIVTVLITICLVFASSYTAKSFFKQNHTNAYLDTHFHYHTHNGSSHKHSHSHTQTSISFTDFFTNNNNANIFDFSSYKQSYFQTAIFIPNPTIESLFRPPKF